MLKLLGARSGLSGGWPTPFQSSVSRWVKITWITKKCEKLMVVYTQHIFQSKTFQFLENNKENYFPTITRSRHHAKILRVEKDEISNFYKFSPILLIFGIHIPPIITIHAVKFH